MLLLQASLTYLRLHLGHEVVLRFHQTSVDLPRHVGKEVGIELSHLLSDDAVDRHLIGGLGVGGDSRVGDGNEGVFYGFDEEEDGCDFVGQFIVDEEVAAHVLIFDVVVEAVDEVFAVEFVVVPKWHSAYLNSRL